MSKKQSSVGTGFGVGFGGVLGCFAGLGFLIILSCGGLLWGINGCDDRGHVVNMPLAGIQTAPAVAQPEVQKPNHPPTEEEKLAEEKRLADIQTARAAEQKDRLAKLEAKRVAEEQRQKDAERLLKEVAEAAVREKQAKLEKEAGRKLTIAKAQLEDGLQKLKNEKTVAEGRKLIGFARVRLEEITREFPSHLTAVVEARKLLADTK